MLTVTGIEPKPTESKPGITVKGISVGGYERGQRLSRFGKRVASDRSHSQRLEEYDLEKSWKRFEEVMDGQPFVVSALVNSTTFANTLRNNLARLRINPREVFGFDGKFASSVNEVAVTDIDLDRHRHRQPRVFLYVTSTGSYDMILGMPWISSENTRIYGSRSEMLIRFTGSTVKSEDTLSDTQVSTRSPVQVSAMAFNYFSRSYRKKNEVQVFAASMKDINKALEGKKRTDPTLKFSAHYHELLDVFEHRKADLLPPLRGEEVDHKIDVETSNGQDPKIPWGSLYSIYRDGLLVLRKTLTELLYKGFIRVSNSPAAAPVLFVREPGGGLRFYVDYRGLNRITRKDRYTLPLIYATLRNTSKAC
ncbi:hypothetical protein K3495_g8919 [Podosphaera aphanis]|nr:hypothetical protein K3495_g8919 [Podosphaera aphanis]